MVGPIAVQQASGRAPADAVDQVDLFRATPWAGDSPPAVVPDDDRPANPRRTGRGDVCLYRGFLRSLAAVPLEPAEGVNRAERPRLDEHERWAAAVHTFLRFHRSTVGRASAESGATGVRAAATAVAAGGLVE